MIKVHLQPEPPEFEQSVRQPGLQALAENRDKLPPYWREVLPQLWEAYRGICAYMGIYIHRVTGAKNVDHFIPKSKDRNLAYEWSNYRLACGLMNARKRDFTDVLDPFEIETGWFIIRNPGFMEVLPNPDLEPDIQERIQQTIDRLKLNAPDCLAVRQQYLNDFLNGDINFDYLERHSPFVAMEYRRQKQSWDNGSPTRNPAS